MLWHVESYQVLPMLQRGDVWTVDRLPGYATANCGCGQWWSPKPPFSIRSSLCHFYEKFKTRASVRPPEEYDSSRLCEVIVPSGWRQLQRADLTRLRETWRQSRHNGPRQFRA